MKEKLRAMSSRAPLGQKGHLPHHGSSGGPSLQGGSLLGGVVALPEWPSPMECPKARGQTVLTTLKPPLGVGGNGMKVNPRP